MRLTGWSKQDGHLVLHAVSRSSTSGAEQLRPSGASWKKKAGTPGPRGGEDGHGSGDDGGCNGGGGGSSGSDAGGGGNVWGEDHWLPEASVACLHACSRWLRPPVHVVCRDKEGVLMGGGSWWGMEGRVGCADRRRAVHWWLAIHAGCSTISKTRRLMTPIPVSCVPHSCRAQHVCDVRALPMQRLPQTASCCCCGGW